MGTFGPGTANSGPTQILVPAYYYPTLSNYWNEMDAAAQIVSLTAILNPNRGPGSAVDPNYFTATNNLRAARGNVIGYVDSDYGSRSLSAVEADIMSYRSFYNVNGFFIDRMSNDPAKVSYYNTIYNFIKSLNSEYQVTGYPGTIVPQVDLTASTADTLVTFEGNRTSYAGATPPASVQNFPAS